MSDDILADQLIAVGIVDLSVELERALTDNKGYILAFGEDLIKSLHCFVNIILCRILADHKVCDVHIFEELERYLTLIDMLRLVMYAGFASPADNEHGGDSIYLVVQKGCDRIDDIALAAVLHIDDGDLAGSQMVTGCQCGTVAFVGGDYVMSGIDAVFAHEVIAECLELGIRNTCIEVGTDRFDKCSYLHILASGILQLVNESDDVLDLHEPVVDFLGSVIP